MFNRVLLIALAISLPAWAGVYDEFVHLSPEDQAEQLGNATPAERIEMMRAIKATVETDPLTGLKNRRSLDRHKRGGAVTDAIAFISFDLDHFKNINDTYGHSVGDEVLTRVSEIARANTREPVFRLGGEEFLIILPNTDAATALTVAERIRKALEDTAFPGHDGLRVTGSFGVSAGRSDNHLTWDALIEASDEASYLAKKGGRNKVVAAHPDRACEILLAGMK